MSDKLGLNIELKKGDPGKLCGKLIAYATVDTDSLSGSNAMESMIKNGILAVQANYVDQRNIKDFFQNEFGISLEKGIQEIIEQAKDSGGLEGALDPDIVRDKLESMRNMEFIPIPAKIAYFESEEEILEREEDIYYLGHFRIVSHAHLCVNSFPILYQAKFREQEHNQVSQEIAEMLKELPVSAIPSKQQDSTTSNISNFKGDLKKHLLKILIPNMLYSVSNQEEYKKAEDQFKEFMQNFSFPEDTREIIRLVSSNLKNDDTKLSRLELMVDKIEALQNEDYTRLEAIKKQLKGLK